MLPPGGVMTLGMLEGIPAVAVLVVWPVADDCTKIDVGGTNTVIVSLPVGTTEKGAAVEEDAVVRTTAGMIVADDETGRAALLDFSVAVVAGKDVAAVPVTLTDAIVVEAEPVVGPAGADKLLEPEPLGAEVATAVSVPVAVALPEAGPEADEPIAVPDGETDDAETEETTSVPETETDGVETGATLRPSDTLRVTLAPTEIEPVPDTGTMLIGVAVRIELASVADTRGTMATPVDELAAVPTKLDTPETRAGTRSEAVPVAAPVSPELSAGVATADEGRSEGETVTSLAEMMVDSPTRMLVGAAAEDESVTAGAAEDAEGDGCKVIAGDTPVDATADKTLEEETAGITAGIIDSAAEEELGSGDEASRVLAAGSRATDVDEGWTTVLGAAPVGATAETEDEGDVSTRGRSVATVDEGAAAELDTGTITSGATLDDAAEDTEATGATEAAAEDATEASDAGTGLTKAVETTISVEVGLAGTASGRCDCTTELETWTTVDDAAATSASDVLGSIVSDVVAATSGVVPLVTICRFMWRGK
jgi:hypothetical protein